MRKTQTSKVNHLLRNGVNFAKNTDTVLPNVDKNSKTIKKTKKIQRTKKIILSVHEKRPKSTKQKYTQ